MSKTHIGTALTEEGGPNQEQYGSTIQHRPTGSGNETAGLPFSGLDIGVLGLAAFALIAVGATLRRVAKRTS